MNPPGPIHPGPDDGYPMQMRRLILAFMVKGPNWAPSSTPEGKRNQADHLALLRRLHQSGELLMSGPIPDGDPERGVLVFDLHQEEDVLALLADDAHLRSGQLAIEMYPWLVPAETLEQPFRSADSGG
ncbi:MAG: YciI family protein [Anaerolineales bacterium]